MFELNLSVSKKGKPKIPNDTGPGPKQLISWTNEIGFFGEVPANELVNSTQLSSELNLTGTRVNTNEPWLKFVKDETILFIAKKPLVTNISYDSLNESGVVYGERVINVFNYHFITRLLTGIDSGFMSDPTLGEDTLITHQSEWNELLYLVSKANASYPKTSQEDDNLAEYTDAELSVGGGKEQWVQNSWVLNENQAVTRGKNAITTISVNDKNLSSSNIGYRPCLQLDFEGFYAPFFTYAGMNFIDTLPLEDRVFEPASVETIGLYIPSKVPLP